jgi:hypothetical protein
MGLLSLLAAALYYHPILTPVVMTALIAVACTAMRRLRMP